MTMSKAFMSHRPKAAALAAIYLCLSLVAPVVPALETDRQQPLEVNADDTRGSLGDGTTLLSGRVDIRQGTLHIQADEAEISKSDGKVSVITFRGQPARLEQEIEEQGLVQAEARTITYRVSAGKVELAGNADVIHPQYRIAGEQLTYDLDEQHFEGSGSDTGDGRISIRLEPEVAKELQSPEAPEPDADEQEDDNDDGAGDG